MIKIILCFTVALFLAILTVWVDSKIKKKEKNKDD